MKRYKYKTMSVGGIDKETFRDFLNTELVRKCRTHREALETALKELIRLDGNKRDPGSSSENVDHVQING